MNLIKPSFSTGYAKNASESANPNLWKGLVGAWMPSFGVTGNTLKDVSGNGNDGTLTNMDASSDWVATSKGLTLDFDGVDDRIDLTTLRSRDHLREEFTISFVAMLNAYSNNRYLFTKHLNTDAQINTLFWISNLGILEYKSFPQSNISTRGIELKFGNLSGLLQGVWRHYTVTSGAGEKTYASNYRVYIDGDYLTPVETRDSEAFTTGNAKGTLSLGGRKFDNNRNTQIKFAGGCVYDRALSAAEIKKLHIATAAPFLRKQQTVGISTAQAFNPYWANQATQLAGTLQ